MRMGVLLGGSVFPTLVGVFPDYGKDHFAPLCLPHARGGVSLFTSAFVLAVMSSPRSWGCFRRILGEMQTIFVFPTLVGVFLPTPPAV